MQRLTKFALFVTTIVTIVTGQLVTGNTAQANTPDSTVKAALDQVVKYEILDNGNFKVVVNITDKGRKQSVYINSGIDQVTTSSLRKVYAFPANASLDNRTMDYAFSDASTAQLGGWEANSDGALVFVAKVDSRLDSKSLRDVIFEVARRTDSLEREMGLADEK
jgi:hypothetical protein